MFLSTLDVPDVRQSEVSKLIPAIYRNLLPPNSQPTAIRYSSTPTLVKTGLPRDMVSGGALYPPKDYRKWEALIGGAAGPAASIGEADRDPLALVSPASR